MTSARLKGLETDLGMTGPYRGVVWLTPSNILLPSDIQYDTVVAILYASYCPAQVCRVHARVFSRELRCSF